MNATRSAHGFTLVEMAVALLILGMLMAFSVPAFQSLNKTNQLHGATENLAANMRVLREKAIATGQTQTLHFTMNFPAGTDWDYHVHNGATTSPGWALPNNINYVTIGINPVFHKDGRPRADTNPASVPISGNLIFRNDRGERDTVSVLASGQIMVR
jgi:prepilin-type N-terminal cleavage/methylation domain-containing protein